MKATLILLAVLVASVICHPLSDKEKDERDGEQLRDYIRKEVAAALAKVQADSAPKVPSNILHQDMEDRLTKEYSQGSNGEKVGVPQKFKDESYKSADSAKFDSDLDSLFETADAKPVLADGGDRTYTAIDYLTPDSAHANNQGSDEPLLKLIKKNYQADEKEDPYLIPDSSYVKSNKGAVEDEVTKEKDEKDEDVEEERFKDMVKEKVMKKLREDMREDEEVKMDDDDEEERFADMVKEKVMEKLRKKMNDDKFQDEDEKTFSKEERDAEEDAFKKHVRDLVRDTIRDEVRKME